MRFITKTLIIVALSILGNAKLHAIQPFVVEDIKVEGLQRVELGTFFTVLPIRIGERLDDTRVPVIIRTLYATGNFDFVKLEKENNTLNIVVAERPTITGIVFLGNKVLKTEQLEEALKSSGIVKNEPLDQFTFSKIQQEIISQYFSNGKYNVEVESKLNILSRNRVNLQVVIDEGSSAQIGELNIVGNIIYPDQVLKDQMELTSGGLFSFLVSDNKYSSTTLEKDIETITSFYKDRGYYKFAVTSTQVSLSSDKQQVYVTINVDEGEKFLVNNVQLIGDLKNREGVFKKLIPLQKGSTYSAAAMSFAEEQMKEYLGYFGYSYPEVRSIAETLDDTNEVDLKILVNPGKRYYVDKIRFNANTVTDENVYRREMRVKEGEPLSSELLDRSKLRLQRIPFIEDVKVDTIKSTEYDDKLDVVVDIKERGAAQIGGGLGYNDTFGLSVQANLSHSNVFGEGKSTNIGFNYSRGQQSVNISYSDPFFTDNGVGFSTSLGVRRTDFEELNFFSGQSLDTTSLSGTLYYPIGEFSTISFGGSYQDNLLKAPGTVDQDVIDFFDSFGQDVRTDPELDFEVVSVNLGWQYSTLNRGIFPTDGSSHNIGIEIGTPLGTTEYYKANYGFKTYIPISNSGWVVSMRANFGYGDGLGDTEDLPYFKNFSGSRNSLRGFEENSIGPRGIIRQRTNLVPPSPTPNSGEIIGLPPSSDSIFINGFSNGGNASALASLELIFPTPFLTDNNNVRSGFFIDAGNIWDTGFNQADFEGLSILASTRRSSQFESVPDFADSSTYRVSAGVAIQWLSPMGPLVFSLSKPIKSEFYDQSKTFTFSIGQTF